MAPNDAGLATRERILDAAIAIAGHEGMPALTTRRVAKEAGVNVGLLHYHFGSKEELVQETVERFKRNILELLESTARGSEGLEASETLVAMLVAALESTTSLPGLVFALVGQIAAELERRVAEGGSAAGTAEAGSLPAALPSALPLGPLQFFLDGHLFPLLRERLGEDQALVERRALQVFTSLFHPALFTPFARMIFGLDLSDPAAREAYIRGVVADALRPTP